MAIQKFMAMSCAHLQMCAPQDYIPREELAKFLAKAGDQAAEAEAKQLAARGAIGPDNVGHRLLSKMGWKEGEGVGAKDNKGITAPIAAQVRGGWVGL